jgi:uncharacterized membrane protein
MSGVILRMRKEAVMERNLGTKERVITGAAAAGLAALAFKKMPLAGRVAAGVASGALVARAATGKCAVKAGVNDLREGKPVRVEKQTVINAPIEQVYEFWNNVENFPKFMSHLQSVVKMSDTRSHWVSDAPLGTKVEWDAETIKNVPNDVIAWRSVEGDIEHTGTVRFKRVGAKTRIKVRIEYTPPAGKIGATVARVFGDDPRTQLEEYLKKAKQILDRNPSVEQIRKGAFPELQSA